MNLHMFLRRIMSGLISNSTSRRTIKGRYKLNYPMPYVMSDELEIIEKIIEALKPKKCLEWGAGGSTLYFPRKYDFITLWLSIEHDRKWFARLKSRITSNVKLVLAENVEEYVLYPMKESNFDLIFIDGRWRILCMLVAPKILSKNGICLLHDSSRPQYHFGFRFFANNLKLTDGFGDSNGLHMFWNEQLPIKLAELLQTNKKL